MLGERQKYWASGGATGFAAKRMGFLGAKQGVMVCPGSPLGACGGWKAGGRRLAGARKAKGGREAARARERRRACALKINHRRADRRRRPCAGMGLSTVYLSQHVSDLPLAAAGSLIVADAVAGLVISPARTMLASLLPHAQR